MSVPRSLAQTCALDVFVANDQSGSVSAIENTQSRQFISALFNGMQPWGTGAGQSRIAIADWDNPGVWQQYSFPVAGQNYTDLLADVLAYQTAPRTLFGGTDPYTALLNCYQQLNQTPIPGRVARPVIVLMTDAACSQVPATLSTLATQVKNAGVYLIVVAIEAASSCPSLAGTNVASPGGYFSAPTYAQLSQANVSLVQQMINAGCTGSVDPSYDLAIALDDFTASGCLSPPATYAVDYTVNNGPGADFVGNLVISFYSADPALPTTSLMAVQNVGAISIPMNGSYSGSFSNAALGATNTLFAIVNFDGSAAGNAPPVTGYYEPDMVEPLEYVTFDNLSNQANRVNDPVSCPPQATITGNIVTGGLGCSDRATYQITICNTGDATAYITPTLPIAVPGAVVITSATQPGNYVDSLDWATYYGGTLLEEGRAVATDPAGNVYLAGTTRSAAAIATAGSHQATAPGNRNAFLAKFNTAGVRLWATYYGGPDPDEGRGVATDALGNVYLVGLTESTSGIATAGTYQTANAGGEDAFIVKFNSAGVRQWASYFGGNDTDHGYSVATDAAGNVYLAGMTEGSSGLASAGAHQTAFAGVSDQFLVKFNGTNGTRMWSTYYGGADEEIDGNVACDPSNNVYLTGQTVSPTGIAAGGWDNALAGNDVYLAKFNSAGVRQWATYYGGPDDEDQGSVACDATGNVYLGGTTDSDAGIAYNALHQGFRAGSKDGFIAQFDGTGTLQWCNYVGGSDNDELRDVAVRSSGDVLVTGSTNSLDNIATLGSYQTVPDGVSNDAFLVKLHSDGSLDWGTYYGGLDDEDGRSVAVDVAGNVYICGTTPSTTLIATPGAHQTTYSDNDDAYLAKFGERELPLILFPDECILREYIVDYSAVAAGTYSLSLGLAATPFDVGDPPPNVMPDQNFNAGTYTGIDGFNGALHTLDDVTVPVAGTACPPGDQISIAVNIPTASSCGNGNYAQATVTITNNSGATVSNTQLHLFLDASDATYASEPYGLSAGLSIPAPNVLDPAYPFVPNAIFLQGADVFLPITSIPPGTSTFFVDINIGSTTTNLFAQIDSIHTAINASGQSNLASDATGVTALTVPVISNFNCPGSIASGGNIVITGISVSGAASRTWSTTTVASLAGTGTVAAPTLTYTPTPIDVANGFVAISLTALSASGCDATETCQVEITNVQYDYGDAPVVYDLNINYQPPAAASTLFAGVNLGVLAPGTEVLANNSVMADGDGNEEDALLFNPWTDPWPPIGSTYVLPTRATNSSSQQAYLHAYVDWDADGDFLDVGESSLNTVVIPPLAGFAVHSMQFTVPPTVNTASLFYIRIRLSVDSMSVMVPYMAAPRGETEDYVWASVGPLPVEMLGFSGHAESNAVRLEWTTATETGSDHFEVERSRDMLTFDPIASVQAAGYSQAITDYDLLDDEAPVGIDYYRLKQVDLNGEVRYHGPIAVSLGAADGIWLQHMDGRSVFVHGLEDTDDLQVIDMTGRIIPIGLTARNVIDLSTRPDGVYLVRVIRQGLVVANLRWVEGR